MALLAFIQTQSGRNTHEKNPLQINPYTSQIDKNLTNLNKVKFKFDKSDEFEQIQIQIWQIWTNSNLNLTNLNKFKFKFDKFEQIQIQIWRIWQIWTNSNLNSATFENYLKKNCPTQYGQQLSVKYFSQLSLFYRDFSKCAYLFVCSRCEWVNNLWFDCRRDLWFIAMGAWCKLTHRYLKCKIIWPVRTLFFKLCNIWKSFEEKLSN